MRCYDIFPSTVKIKHDFIEVDGNCISTISIIKYESNIEIFKTLQKLMCLEEIQITFHISRQNNFDILKKLTNIIANSGAEISSISKNQIDINIIDNVKENAISLRKKIQIDNEQIYLVNTYITLKAINQAELYRIEKQVINYLYANQIIGKLTNFKHKEAYIATLPLMLNDVILSKHGNNIFTENALSKLFPFYSDSILEKNGIIVGKVNGNLCMLDIFSNKNNNYNMCVFGSSGVGKSYFIKLMIIKNAYKGIRQIIVDPEGEYVNLVDELGGYVYDIDNYNPFEIQETFTSSSDFFNNKIEQILEYISTMVEIEDKQMLKECIKKVYNNYGINDKKESLFNIENEEIIYIKPKYTEEFPNLSDLTEEIKKINIEDYRKIKNLKSNNSKTSSLNTELYCFRLKGATGNQIEKELKIFIPKIYEMIREETLIYFDEVWKSICSDESDYVIENLYNMFKTLRKRKAGVVIISQDICDLFNMDNGNFGKSILNNSNTKLLFNMDWKDLEIIDKMLLGKHVEERLKILTKGNAYVILNNTSFNLEILASNYEHMIIEGEKNEKSISCNK